MSTYLNPVRVAARFINAGEYAKALLNITPI